MQVMASLQPIVPQRQLLDMCMRGKTLTSDDALKLGIATQVVELGELNNVANALVEELKNLSPSAIHLGLKAWNELKDVPESEAHPFLLGMLQKILATEDAAEGMQAFIEKRKPVWKGR